MALTNPILDEISNLSPDAQAALVAAHGATSQPAAAAPPPAPMMAPPAGAAPMMGAPAPKNELGDPMGSTNELGGLLPPKEEAPGISAAPPARGTLLGDQNELARKVGTGSGISQIAGKVEGSNFGQNHPLLGKIAGVGAQALATLGDAGLSAVLPQVSAMLPGTEYRHDRLVKQDRAQVNQDETDAEKEAQTGLLGAQATYENARPAIEQSKIDQRQEAVRQKIQQQAAARAQTVEFDEDGVPTFTDNPELQAYHTAAATALLHTANAEKAEITGEIAKNHYVPGTPEYEEAQRKLAVVDRKISLAGMNASLRAKEFEAHAYGTVGGQELSGALHDQNGTPVGTFNAANVKPTTTERDAAGRANTMTEVQGRIEKAMQDPEIAEYMGPLGGRLAEAQGTLGTLPPKVAEFQNDLVSYGAFQAGLHPVKGIGALEYFDKVLGGLHQTPEQLRGKLASNAATAGAVQKTGEMPTAAGQQRQRTAPNPAGVPGGAPKDGDTKVNGAGIKVKYSDGKWGPA